jgi:hypothetical protein
MNLAEGRHLRRDWRFQFSPSTYANNVKSNIGVVQVGVATVNVSIASNPANSFTVSPTFSDVLFCEIESNASNMQVGWLFTLSAGFGSFSPTLYCKATNVSPYGFYGGVAITFQTYRCDPALEGETYQEWYLKSDLLGSTNYVQNSFFGAVGSKDRYFTSLGSFTFPYLPEFTTTITSDTPLVKSGYVTSAYNGRIAIDEDGYEYNRPYIGINLEVKREMIKTIYDSLIDPVSGDSETTVTVLPMPAMVHSHTFTDVDFIPTNAPPMRLYQPGGVAPNQSPSRCITYKSLGTYEFSSYKRIYIETYPNGPEEPPVLKQIVDEQTFTTFLDDGIGTINPGNFFPGGTG